MRRCEGWTRGIVMAGGLVSLAAGCATGGTSSAERAGERDVRGSVVVSGAHARSALAGPLHLLHVDYEAGAAIDLYSVPLHDGTDADCAGPALMHLALHGRRPNPIDADVGAGEMICLVAAPDVVGNPVRVSWHAIPRAATPPLSLAQAFPPGR
ncbi:MAG: hypothetical protein ABUS79_10340 [Pseudomonadota bacterium]